MAGEDDQTTWLPKPPPPRPTRRDEAIEAAMRKFDGKEDAPASVPERARSRGWMHRPQPAMLVTASLLLVVAIPATLIGLRNSEQRNEATPPPTSDVRYEP